MATTDRSSSGRPPPEGRRNPQAQRRQAQPVGPQGRRDAVPQAAARARRRGAPGPGRARRADSRRCRPRSPVTPSIEAVEPYTESRQRREGAVKLQDQVDPRPQEVRASWHHRPQPRRARGQADPHPRRARAAPAPHQGRRKHGQAEPPRRSSVRSRPRAARCRARPRASSTGSPRWRKHAPSPRPGRRDRDRGETAGLIPRRQCSISPPSAGGALRGAVGLFGPSARIAARCPTRNRSATRCDASSIRSCARTSSTLGMVRSIEQPEEGRVDVVVSLTTPGCPIRSHFQQAVVAERRLARGRAARSTSASTCSPSREAGPAAAARPPGRTAAGRAGRGQERHLRRLRQGRRRQVHRHRQPRRGAAGRGQAGRRARRRRVGLLDPAHARRARPPDGLRASARSCRSRRTAA